MKLQWIVLNESIRAALRGMVACLLAAAVFFPVQAKADIYKKRLPDGTLCFTNCPIGDDWDVYYREKKRRSNSYRFPSRPPYDPSRSSNYDSLIRQIAFHHGVNPDLVKGIIHVESQYNPQALSSKGAMGLMQLMPETASILGVRDPWDPLENITGGTKYISYLLKKYNGNLTKALAAYNAGPAAVDSYDGIPPYQETQDYVRSVLGILNGGRR
jgi:soluble lytic murein transglycosylase-like protein